MNNIEWSSVALGVLLILALASFVALLISSKRHPCSFCLGGGKGRKNKTKKTCRLWVHQKEPNIPVGMTKVTVYIFFACSQYDRHVICTIKTMPMSDEKIAGKDPEELDWDSKFINDLCERAKVKNPAHNHLIIFPPVKKVAN